MLLYVDKRKERQKTIQKICIVLVLILVLLANFVYLKNESLYATQSLTNYKLLKHLNKWYHKTDAICLFASPHNNNSIILIPDKINRLNIKTLAYGILKLPQNIKTIKISENIKEQQLLLSLLQTLRPNLSQTDNNPDLLITTNFSNIENIIREKQLYPAVLNYKNAKSTPQIDEFLNTYFPKKKKPQTKQEKELQALHKFSLENLTELKEIILYKKDIDFKTKYLFLKNIRLCLKTEELTLCEFSTKNTLQKNIYTLLKKIPKQQIPKKLLLLTSDQLVALNQSLTLTENEGLHFTYKNRETYLLPEEIKKLENKKDILYILKEKIGINPEYTNNQMNLYKFKIKEVTLNGKI